VEYPAGSDEVADAVASVFAAGSAPAPPGAWATILDYLGRVAAAEQAHDPGDVVQEAALRLNHRVRAGAAAGTPTRARPYLRQIVRHVIIDLHRRTATETTVAEPPVRTEADGSNAVVDCMLVQAGLDAALQARDLRAIRVLTAFVDLAHEGTFTSDRKVAARAGTSHPTVRAVYNRFARWATTGSWPHGPPSP
jgi:DNA-directed RNA polymerase specialized sigma24 family protein